MPLCLFSVAVGGYGGKGGSWSYFFPLSRMRVL